MLKAELEKEHASLLVQYEKLAEECIQLREDNAQLTSSNEVLDNRVKKLKVILEDVKDSEHAMRCVAIPGYEAQIERLEKLLDEVTRRERKQEAQYYEALGVLKGLIQKAQIRRYGVESP